MNVHKKGKRLFSLGILLVLCVLAVGTASFASAEDSSPYAKLVVEKVVQGLSGSNVPGEFHFTVVNADDNTDFTTGIVKPGEPYGGSWTESSSRDVTVTEDETTAQVDDYHLTVTYESYYSNTALVSTGIATPSDGSTLTIDKSNTNISSNGFTYTYHITAPSNNIDSTLTVSPGGSAQLPNLPAGTYTISEEPGVSGFSVEGLSGTYEPEPGEYSRTLYLCEDSTLTLQCIAPTALADVSESESKPYLFYVTGPSFSEQYLLSPGENVTIPIVKAGNYTVKEYIPNNTYTFTYNDQVHGTYSGTECASGIIEGDSGKIVVNASGPEGGTATVKIAAYWRGTYQECSFTVNCNSSTSLSTPLSPGEYSVVSVLDKETGEPVDSYDLYVVSIGKTITFEADGETYQFEFETPQFTNVAAREIVLKAPALVDSSLAAAADTYIYTATNSATGGISGPYSCKPGGSHKFTAGRGSTTYTIECYTQCVEPADFLLITKYGDNDIAAYANDSAESKTATATGDGIVITKPDGSDSGRGYTFKVKCTVNGQSYETYVTLRAGESQEIRLAEGVTEYTVEEIDVEFTATLSWPGNTVFADSSNVPTVRIINTYSKDPETPPPPPPSSPKTGYYTYIHEYYYKDPDGSLTLEGTSDFYTSSKNDLPNNKRYTEADVGRMPEYGDYTYTYYEAAYGTTNGTTNGTTYAPSDSMSYVVDTENGSQIIILRYVREDEPDEPEEEPTGSYKYVHEYYYKDADGNLTFEGRTEIFSSEDGLPLDGTPYYASSVALRHEFGEHYYNYDSAAYGRVTEDGYTAYEVMEYVVATETGEEIIILRYVRTTNTPPDLPDPNDPDSPEEITIWDDDVPLTYIKTWNPETEEWEWIPDEDIPLAGLNPETGEAPVIALSCAAGALALAGLAVLVLPRKKKQ